MNSIYNSRNNIFELQEMLREISKHYIGIRFINPDGLFKSETAEAVRDVQKMFGIEPTGDVDFETWSIIVEKFRNNIK